MPSALRLCAGALAAALFPALAAARPASSPPAAPPPSDCDQLVPSSCLHPFPSDFWLSSRDCPPSQRCATWLAKPTCVPAAGGSGSGVPCRPQVNVTAALPVDILGHPMNAKEGGWDALDGFSPSGNLQAHFPGHLLADSDASINRNSPRFWNISVSLTAESSTVLIDTSTGERVAHWVELDHSFGGGDPSRRPLLIWPAKRLKSATRYIVAVHNLHNASGLPVTPSPYFAALRDGDPSAGGWRADAFKDVFARLEAAGVRRDGTLQLAWDFTTASREALTSRLLHMRDDALRRHPDGPRFTIVSTEDNYSAHIARRVEGVMYAPWYLNQHGPGKTTRIVLDTSGNPVYQGTWLASFEILIPRSVIGPSGKQARVVQYGHGLFGDKSEVETGYLQEDADRYGYVLAASDWIGLSAVDELFVADMMLTNLTDFAMVADRSTQGVINALMLMRGLKGPSGTLLRDANIWTIDGQKVNVDGTLRSYFGNSQGGILGTLYMSVSTDVECGLIGVGGGSYSLLLPRSHDFVALGDVLKVRYPDPLDLGSLFGLFQMLWDRAEPSGYVDGMTTNTLPGTPSHRVLFHYGLGDAQVTWLGAQMLARGTGSVSMFESNVLEGNETFFGYTMVPDTAVITTGNAIVGFDFGAPTVPFINVPADKATDAHEKPRRDRHAQDMMNHFFVTGEIVNTCGGPCRNISHASRSAPTMQ